MYCQNSKNEIKWYQLCQFEAKTMIIIKSTMPRSKQPKEESQSKQSSSKKQPENEPILTPQRDTPKLKQKVSINSQNFVMRRMGSFDQDYMIMGKLGEGTFGTVYKVMHRMLKIQRALKSIKKRGKKHFSSFQEIEILKKLDHANILKIYEFYQAPDNYYIITDIFQGRQLFDQIADNEYLSQRHAADILRQVLRALNYTHSLGIAHRDMKPQNILVRRQQDKFKIKIIDWGLGTLMQDGRASRICGTPQYAAPQVLKGDYDLSCDLWSVGGIAFVMLTGQMPFSGSNTQETLQAVRRGVIDTNGAAFKKLSPLAQQFIVGLMNKDPKMRLTAGQALQHSWIQIYGSNQSVPVQLKQTLQRLRSFKLGSSLGIAVTSFINNHLSAQSQRQSLEQIFKHLDVNSDGVLSMEELANGYMELYGKELGRTIAQQTFAKLDINQNNSLQFSEFVTFGLQQKRQQLQLKLKQAFRLFDRDGNGKISRQQLGMVLQGRMDAQLSAQMMQVVKQIDEDGDGQIDVEEFMRGLEVLEKRKSEDLIKIGIKSQKQQQVQEQKKYKTSKQKKQDPVNQGEKSVSRRSNRKK